MSERHANKPEESRPACHQFDRDLPAYLEGEERPGVPAHARQCAYCGVLLADLEQMRFACHHLSLEEPSARVWANVRATLAYEGAFREQGEGWGRWLPRFVFRPACAPIGAVAFLVVLGLALMTPSDDFGGRRTPARTATGGTAPVATTLVASVDGNLLATIGEMEAAYVARETFLDPTLKSTYRKSLDSLNACIKECLKHCQREPTNTLAREFLLSAYQQKAEVLAAALTFPSR